MLTSRQRGRLTALANKLEPSVSLGKGGPSPALLAHLQAELERHELVKLRFADFKEGRLELARELAERTGAELVRVLGNTAIFFRPHPDPEKRSIELD